MKREKRNVGKCGEQKWIGVFGGGCLFYVWSLDFSSCLIFYEQRMQMSKGEFSVQRSSTLNNSQTKRKRQKQELFVRQAHKYN